jgi:anti-anti-sigma factor
VELTCAKHGDSLVVRIKGRMDTFTAPDFEKACACWVEQGDTSLVVDLEGLEYISSAGLRSILVAAKRLQANGGRMRFCCLTGMVQKVFSLANFAAMFPTYESLEQALKQN